MVADIEVNPGKESALNIAMRESVSNLKVVIEGYKNKGEAINEMSLVSTRSISAVETKRYAGGLDDPSKILTNFSGVTSSQNGQNDIIVRGNSPKYVQWRLEGIEITNPKSFCRSKWGKGEIQCIKQ
ncbi:MAG: hypothetical protein IPN88_16975 [Bacteroidetes bacterium]|nr:hypothetical protein [Bacteroidota bacterium]